MFKDQHSLFIIEEKMQKRNTTNTTTNEINLSHGRGKFYQSNQRRSYEQSGNVLLKLDDDVVVKDCSCQ